MAMASAAASTMSTAVAQSPRLWSDAAGSGRGISRRAGERSLVVRAGGPRLSWASASASAATSERRWTSEFSIVSSTRSGLSRSSASGNGLSNKLWTEWRRAAVAEQLQSETSAFPADSISIFFEAEGSLPDGSVTKLTATLEGIDGVSDIDVRSSTDGTATVKLTKQMNVQATGVASGLVEVLLQAGFKIQALNLGFDEDDGNDDDFYDYDLPTTTEETEAAE